MTAPLRAALLALPLLLAAAGARAEQVYRLYVDGLACPFCAYGVEKKVGGLDGVARVDIDLEGGFVAVEMRDGRRLDEAAAGRAVSDAGFTLRRIQVPDSE